MQSSPRTINVFNSKDDLTEAARRFVTDCARQAISLSGRFNVALSGGTTPADLYRRLATVSPENSPDWTRTYIFFSDERYVPRSHQDSNYLMVQTALLSRITMPAQHVFPIDTSHSIDECSRLYHETLLSCLPSDSSGVPIFDLILLGMGNDGHMASLFPGTTALQVRDRSVADVYVPKLNAWRITLTYPVLNAAKNILILVSGAEKAAMVRNVLENIDSMTHVPIMDIAPQGKVTWMLDQDAAAELKHLP